MLKAIGKVVHRERIRRKLKFTIFCYENDIPNVYCINGKIVFELPNGELTTQYSFSTLGRVSE